MIQFCWNVVHEGLNLFHIWTVFVQNICWKFSAIICYIAELLFFFWIFFWWKYSTQVIDLTRRFTMLFRNVLSYFYSRNVLRNLFLNVTSCTPWNMLGAFLKIVKCDFQENFFVLQSSVQWKKSKHFSLSFLFVHFEGMVMSFTTAAF